MVGVVLINFLCFVVVRVFCRPTEEQIVRLKIHHGGMFIYKSSTVYVNSEIVEEEWGWDVDTMSYIDLTKVIKSLGYKTFKWMAARATTTLIGKKPWRRLKVMM